MSLGARTLRSSLIVTATSFAIRGVNVISIMVLARLLFPADFGTIALALVVVQVTQLFSTVGMGSAVIASREEPASTAFHAFVVNLALGLPLFAAAALLAHPLADLLGADGGGSVFRWMSLVILVNTLAVVPDALLIKHSQFGRRAAAQFAEAGTQFAVSIILAAIGMGVFSLVAGHIAGASVGLIVRAALTPRIGWLRPRPWDRPQARSLLRFGGTAMSTGIVRHVYSSGDNVFIGRLFGASALGYYSQAYNLTNISVQSVSQVVNTVLLPVYAEARDDAQRVADGFVRVFQVVGLVTVPLGVGFVVLAPEAIVLLLGERWLPSTVLLQILAVMTVVRPLSGTTSPLFLGINRPELNLQTAIVQAVLLVPLAFAMLPLGTPGIAVAVAATFTLGLIYNLCVVALRTEIPVDFRRLLLGLLTILLVGSLMGGIVLLAKLMLVNVGVSASHPGTLLALVGIGSIAYLLGVRTFAPSLSRELLVLVRAVRQGHGRPPSAATGTS